MRATSYQWLGRNYYQKDALSWYSTLYYTIYSYPGVKTPKQESLPRLGQPRKFTEDDRDNIYGIIQETPSISTEKLLTEVDFKVRRQSIWRLHHQMGLRKWKKMRRPALKPIHAEQCLCWARRWQHLEPSGWACVYFSDECTSERGIGARQEWTFTRPKTNLITIQSKALKFKWFHREGSKLNECFGLHSVVNLVVQGWFH